MKDVCGRTFSEAFGALGSPDFWGDDELRKEISGILPAYRLSKFQSLIPPWVERETLSRFLLDIPAAKEWLERLIGTLSDRQRLD